MDLTHSLLRTSQYLHLSVLIAMNFLARKRLQGIRLTGLAAWGVHQCRHCFQASEGSILAKENGSICTVTHPHRVA